MKVMRYLEQKAQGMVEYALILAFVVGIATVALSTSGEEGLGKGIKQAFQNVADTLDSKTKTTNAGN